MTEAQAKPALKRTLVGRVVSNKMQKTVTVLVERKVKLPLRWLKGFVEVQSYQRRMELRATLPVVAAVRFLRSLPNRGTDSWLRVEHPRDLRGGEIVVVPPPVTSITMRPGGKSRSTLSSRPLRIVSGEALSPR